MKNQRIIVRASEELIKETQTIAEILEVPFSQHVREAIKEKNAQVKKEKSELFIPEPEPMQIAA